MANFIFDNVIWRMEKQMKTMLSIWGKSVHCLWGLFLHGKYLFSGICVHLRDSIKCPLWLQICSFRKVFLERDLQLSSWGWRTYCTAQPKKLGDPEQITYPPNTVVTQKEEMGRDIHNRCAVKGKTEDMHILHCSCLHDDLMWRVNDSYFAASFTPPQYSIFLE